MKRVLGLLAAAAAAASAWFVFELWRVTRDDELPDDVTDEEIERLADNGIVGMPPRHPYRGE